MSELKLLEPGDDIPEDADLRSFARELHRKLGEINARAEAFYSAIESDLKGISFAQLAMFNVLAEKFDNAEIGVRLSQLRAAVGEAGGRGFHHIMQSAIRETILREYPTLENAPEWVQAMCRGEGVAAVAKPGDPGSFKGSEGPR